MTLLSVTAGVTVYGIVTGDSPTKKILKRFSKSKIEATCKDSPQKISYTKCFQRKISSLYEVSEPVDVYYINQVINQVFKKDYNKNGTDPNFYIVLADYAYSWRITIDHMRNFNLHRNSTSYLQITAKPLFDYYLTAQVKNAFQQIKINKATVPQTYEYFERFEKSYHMIEGFFTEEQT